MTPVKRKRVEPEVEEDRVFKIRIPSNPDPPVLPPTRTTRSVSQRVKASGTAPPAPEIPLPALFPFTPPPTNAVAGPSGTSSAPPVPSPLKAIDEDVTMGVEGESELSDLGEDEGLMEKTKGKGKAVGRKKKGKGVVKK